MIQSSYLIDLEYWRSDNCLHKKRFLFVQIVEIFKSIHYLTYFWQIAWISFFNIFIVLYSYLYIYMWRRIVEVDFVCVCVMSVVSEVNYKYMSKCIIYTSHGDDTCVCVCSCCRRWFSIQKNQLVYQKKHNVSIKTSYEKYAVQYLPLTTNNNDNIFYTNIPIGNKKLHLLRYFTCLKYTREQLNQLESKQRLWRKFFAYWHYMHITFFFCILEHNVSKVLAF